MTDAVTTEKTVKAAASDLKHGMTLDELAAFVQQAHRDEVPGTAIVKVTATIRGSIKRAEVKS